MKSKNPISYAGVFLLALLLSFNVKAQPFGSYASAVWITDCNQSNFFNTTGSGPSLIGPAGNVFHNSNLGVHTQGSSSLILRGGEVKTFKNPASANVCGVRMFYRVYLQSAAPGAFTSVDLPFYDNCNAGAFPTGGACTAGDQKWQRVTPDGASVPYAPVNLTALLAGNYYLEVYYEVEGSNTSTSGCGDIVFVNNGGANYRASFSIQSPNIVSTNPTTCNGTNGSVSINGLVPGATYDVSYTDDGVPVGPLSLTANASGQIIITGLNAGLYSNFALTINGCTTNLFTGVILSNPIFLPVFAPIPAFCAGTTAPTLPPTSLNGISGTWSPATVSNTASGTYTFTPTNGQCALQVSINVTVIPRTTPTFSFGTSLSICNGAAVPSLPPTSINGVNGTWSPSTISNTTSGTYTFTPNSGQCANPATLTVTVNPNITPTFSFGTSLTLCNGASVPTLPGTSTNGITGTWSPATVSNTTSGTYTFTPNNPSQCGTTTTLTVTVNPLVTPTFSFGTSLTICSGGAVPTLPGISDNGITGTWSPATVSNSASGTYTFTPNNPSQCGTTTTLTVTVNPLVTPTFSFGTSLSICSGAAVPSLPGTSQNGITGTWSPATVSNTANSTYTFTPNNPSQCGITTTLTVTVNPNITPTFSFGTSLSICNGASVPTLPGTSQNGITGTWSPATVSNTASGTYTFTPNNPSQCGTTTTLTVTVNPLVTPTFSFGTSLSICSGGAVPTLPGISDNGITGTWSPAIVSNTASGTYTFTPNNPSQCGTTTTLTVTVNPLVTPTFSFGTSLSICSGGAVPTLPGTSTNGITGTWSPATISNTTSGTYTFTPNNPSQCGTTTTLTVTVNPNITPVFSFGTSLTICNGASVPALPGTSTNGITGTWSPSTISNTASGTYTFTPNNAAQCGTTTTLTVTVNPLVTPTFSFGTSLSICSGGAVPTLPGISDNGITGTWSPATVSNTASGTYTFTPNNPSQCGTTTTLTVTVNPLVTPTFSFGTSLTICSGGTVPSLPTTSINGITGTWSPATISNTTSGTYTFTPNNLSQCGTTTTLTVTVNPLVTPTFSFGTSLTICNGASVPNLPGTSTNGITGTWSPATISNTTSGTYTFTPNNPSQCGTTTTLTVTINPNITPVFSFGTSLTICSGASVPTLPGTSDNGITGTWSPATVSNTTSGTYTFTPNNPSQCGTSTSFTVTVNPTVTPVFSFGTALSICNGGSVPSLPGTSTNGITGTWSPATVSNTASGTYTFTPNNPGQCGTTATLTVTVNPIVTPAFSFGTSLTICSGATVPSLPLTSSNGITGTWSPSTISNTASGTYTFTPNNAAQCATTTSLTVTVTPNVTPVFSFGTALTICSGGSVPQLPSVSDNSISGTWSPATVSNTASGVYTFTPAAGVCAPTVTYTVTVNPIVTPSFGFNLNQSICIGGNVPPLTGVSTNGVNGTWSPATVSNQASGTYTFTPSAGQCANPVTLTVQVNPVPILAAINDITVNDGAVVPATIFTVNPGTATINWTNSNTAIGLTGSGSGNVPQFTATNPGTANISGTLTVTPNINGCVGAARSFVITVRPLDKGVFVPNVFSPNNDGKNDKLLVFGNYIRQVEMRVFNQWGEQVALINSQSQGWDGTHKGKPQPVGVYVYALRAVMTDGRVVELKGSVTLVR